MTEYVVQDRSLATKWAISIADGELKYAASASAASSDPIVEDYLNAGTYWKIFIDDGEMGYESTVTVQNDNMLFTDTVDSSTIQLAISDGEMVMIPQVTAAITRLTNHRIVRYSVVPKIKRYEGNTRHESYSSTPKVSI